MCIRDNAPSAVACEGDMVYTFTYTDCAGNSDVWTYTYTINIPPSTIAAPDGASTVDCPIDAVAPTPPTVVVFFLMIRRPPGSTLDRSSAASDVYKRQFTYTDCAGNSDVWTYTY